jgi:uncharacterized membrane protein
VFRKQPKIDVKPNSIDRKLILAGWLLIAANFIIILIAYAAMPETIATHFNLKGEPNGYSSKDSIWIMPILNLILYYGMNQITTKIKPWNHNYPTKVTEKNAPKLYGMSIRMLTWLNLSITALFLFITIQIIALGYSQDNIRFSWLTMVFVGLITLLPFVYIIKMFNVPKE